MKLFEALCQNPENPYEFILRYNENNITKTTDLKLFGKSYIPDISGDYTYLFNEKLRLKQVLRKDIKDYTGQRYGESSIASEYIRENFWSVDKSNYNLKPSIFYLDIETTAKNPVNVERCGEQIVSIQIYHNLTNTNIILALEDFNVNEHTTKDGFYEFDDRTYDFKLKYIKLDSESELLKSYFKIIEALKPLIVLAHNGEGFDYAYLWKRTEFLGLKEGFSPFGKSKQRVVEFENGTKKYCIESPCVFYMDSIDVYKKFRYGSRESYSLDYLAEVELGEHKVNHNCYSTFDGFRTGLGYKRPTKEPSKDSILEYKLYHAKSEDEIIRISKEYFIHYSIIDTYLLFKIDKAIRLTDIMLNLCSSMGVQINQSLGTTTPWANYIRNYALTKGIVLPNPKDNSDEIVDFKGGFVKEPITGRYDWVYSVDVTSMYPSQIMAFNLSPETYIPREFLNEDLKNAIVELDLSEDETYHIQEYLRNPKKYEKYSELLKRDRLCGSLSGAVYDKTKQGLIPFLIELQFKNRKRIKAEMLDVERRKETTEDPKIKEELEELSTMLDVQQLSIKTRINSLYGALSNPHFLLYNKEIAKSITSNSRFYVNLMSENIETYQKTLDSTAMVLYGDTDSLLRDAEIIVNNSRISIGDFYDSVESDAVEYKNNKFIKHVSNLTTPSVNTKLELETKNIKYVMKHKVKKRMFEIKVNNKSVKITEDHSIMINRKGELLSVKPTEIKKGDLIICLCIGMTLAYHENFEITDLGIQEIDVYDIEVEDNHNFFANDILVHNSAYIKVPSTKIKGSNLNEITDNISEYIETEVQPVINNTSKELGDIFNALDSSKISAKREVIASSAVFIAKKRYFMRVIDSEFVRFEKPKLKMVGIDIIRSSTPKFSKNYLKKSIDIILESTESELKNWISKVRDLYLSSDLINIAKTSSVNSSSYKLGVDKSIPINSRGFLVTNQYLDSIDSKEFNRLQLGERIKFLYLKVPNPLNSNIFAFDNNEFAEKFRDFIDWDTNFDKFFLKTLEIMTKPLNYNLNRVTETLDLW